LWSDDGKPRNFSIDEARPGFKSQDAPSLESSALTQNLQSYEKELIEAAFAESKTEKSLGQMVLLRNSEFRGRR
jgi:hypothetical protein